MTENRTEVANWKLFYESTSPPSNLQQIKEDVDNFCHEHFSQSCDVVLVTSGGTSVPLELNTVRFVDNFSSGTRGTASTEYFLEHGYAVVFLHRLKSLQPFSRHLPPESVLDMLTITADSTGRKTVQVLQDKATGLVKLLEKHHEVKISGRLLKIPFTTLTDYLWLLRTCTESLAVFGKRTILYLAAAVSDFYIPSVEMSTHKIESTSPLNIHLRLVPKMLHPLVKHWVTNSFVISFKLETDSSIVVPKAKQALHTYGHKLVIANLLQSYKRTVTLVSQDSEQVIEISVQESEQGVEIESKIVDEIVKRHAYFKNEQ